MLAVLQYDFKFEFPLTHVRLQFNSWHQQWNAQQPPLVSPQLEKKLYEDSVNITMDTYFLHDYFLYYTPILLAGASLHLAIS